MSSSASSCGMNSAFRRSSPFQSRPRKKGCCLTSDVPPALRQFPHQVKFQSRFKTLGHNKKKYIHLEKRGGKNTTGLQVMRIGSSLISCTCSKSFHRTLPQKACDHVLGICRQGIISIWPNDVICISKKYQSEGSLPAPVNSYNFEKPF